MDRGEPSLKPEWLVRGHGAVAATSLWTGTSSPRAGELAFNADFLLHDI
jgi:hypothetical protein